MLGGGLVRIRFHRFDLLWDGDGGFLLDLRFDQLLHRIEIEGVELSR